MTWGPNDEQAIRRGRWTAWLPFMLTALVLAGTFAFGTGIYDELPDPLPTHWGPGGEPDSWEEKSFGNAFMGLIVTTGTIALMAVMAAIVPAMSQPAKDPTPWKRYRQEGTTRSIVGVLGWVSLLTALFVGYLSVRGWTTPEHIGLAWPLAAYLVGTIAVLVLPFRRWDRWSSNLAAANGVFPSEEDLAEDNLWLPGGIYNNPDDPHIMVPKREGHGTGLTVNVGHRRGKTAVAIFLGIFVVVPLALVLAFSLFG